MWPPPDANPKVDKFFDALSNAAAEGCFNCLLLAATGFCVVVAAGFWLVS